MSNLPPRDALLDYLNSSGMNSLLNLLIRMNF
jgi:hypothetical protein